MHVHAYVYTLTMQLNRREEQAMRRIEKVLENYINSACEFSVYDCWTDGSCNNLSLKGEGGAAYIVLRDGVEVRRASKGLTNTTNNRAEMLAIISAVNWCPVGVTINVHTDSKYCIGSFMRKGTLKDELKNKDLIRLYRKVSAGKQVIFDWVKGHNGNTYNEIVDQMANGEYRKVCKNVAI